MIPLLAFLLSFPQTSNTDSAAVKKVLQDIITADNAGDLEAVMQLYAENAILLPPNEPPVIGKQFIRPRYQKLFQDNTLQLVNISEETRVAGDWAYDRGTNTDLLTPKSGEQQREINDKYLMILKQQPNGAWKIATLIWNSTPPTKE